MKQICFKCIFLFVLNNSCINYITPSYVLPSYIPDSTALTKQSSFKSTPFTVLYFTTPGTALSYERRIAPSISGQITGTYLFPGFTWNQDYDRNYYNLSGYGLALESKVFLKRNEKGDFVLRKTALVGPYLALEGRYLNAQYTDAIYFGPDIDDFADSLSYLDTVGISRKIYDINIKIGYQWIRKSWTFDLYFGLGARYRDVRHSERLRPEDIITWPRHPFSNYSVYKEGLLWTMSVPLNFRVGYAF